jgi:hypothetical protein
VFWAEATRLAWFPWVEAMRAAMVQQGPAPLPERRPALQPARSFIVL